MAQALSLKATIPMRDDLIDAATIPALAHEEAGVMAREELQRFLTLVETLSGDDWEQPTDCTEWSVRDILAHQAGAYAGYTSWGEFKRQITAKPAPGQMQVDALNRRQLADRAGRTPVDLIGELRTVGPKGIRTRQRLPWPLRKLKVPFGAPLGTVSVEYLTDLLYTRDTWMHRADIARATGRAFAQTAEHDGRVTALVLRDLAHHLKDTLRGRTVMFDLSGAGGGRYRIGTMAEPTVIVKMDVVDFQRLASGRLTSQAAKEQGRVTLSGDRSFGDQVLAATSVPY
ncbi:MAG TPA: maleylpyruvate isomerase family mycothiol-dependent enzyme [Anaerolineae bacterium]|nr:maleylpyruvate isomerase family mycothiol-dependent enzyme [Anaerolineae bacterium]